MKSIDELAELFKSFPGVGPRQARRFVYYLLGAPASLSARVADLITSIKSETATCTDCHRLFPKESAVKKCKECRDEKRDKTLLAVVPRDSDREALEKSGSFRGFYFVLGGSIPILGDDAEKRVRLPALLSLLQTRAATGLKEVILAMDANPEGDHTAEVIAARVAPIAKEHGFTISVLGRGLSTGTELEYADSETIKNALGNRGKAR